MKKSYEIKKNIIEISKASSAIIEHEQERKRAFALSIAALSFASILKSEEYDVSFKHSLFKIPAFAQNFELADIYVANARIDVRVTFEDENFYIPKAHKKYGAAPNYYVIVKLEKDFSQISLLGYIEPSALDEETVAGDYYLYDTQILRAFKSFKKAIKDIKPQMHSFSSQDHEKISELALAFFDSEISESEKIFFIKHVVSCEACREKICELNEFDTIINQVKNYPELLDDGTLNVLTGYNYVKKEEPLYEMPNIEEEKSDFMETEISPSMFEIVKDITAAGTGAVVAGACAAGTFAAEVSQSAVLQAADGAITIAQETVELSVETVCDSIDTLSDLVFEDEVEDKDENKEDDKEVEEESHEISDLENMSDLSVISDMSDMSELTELSELTEHDQDDLDELSLLEQTQPQEETDEKYTAQTLDETEDTVEEDIAVIDTKDLEEDPAELEADEPQVEDEISEEEDSQADEEVDELHNDGLELEDLEALDDEMPMHLEEHEETSTTVSQEEEEEDTAEQEEPELKTEEENSEQEDEEHLEEHGEEDFLTELHSDEDDMHLEEHEDVELFAEHDEPEEETQTEAEKENLTVSEVEEISIDMQETIVEEEEIVTAQIEETVFVQEEEIQTSYSGVELIDEDETPAEAIIVEEEEEVEGIETVDEEIVEESEISQPEETPGIDPDIQSLLDDELMQLLASNDDEAVETEEYTNIPENEEPAPMPEEDTIAGMDDDTSVDTLFEKNSNAQEEGNETVLDLSKEPISESTANMTKKIVTAVVLLFLVTAGSVTALYLKFNKANNSDALLPDMNPQAQEGLPLENASNKPSKDSIPEPAMSQDINKSMTNVFSDQPAAITITKISWEVSQKLASDPTFKNYLQVAGKNLQLNLQNDLSYVTDVNYSNKVKVSLEIAKDNSIKRVQATESSGSEQIDNVVLQSIKETLKYINVPDIKDYKGNYNLSVVVNF